MKRREEKINKNEGGIMSRKINLSKIIIFILMLTMIATILVSDTYSRFTTTASGSDSVVVAKWSFKVNGEEIAVEGDAKTIEFGLFDTIYDSDGETEETDVESGLIAPGTSGSFEFTLQNTSEVTAQYGIDFEVANENNIPIEYSFDEIVWKSDLEDIELSDDTKLEIDSNTKTEKIYWRWAFEGNTDADTIIGSAAGEATEENEIPNITVKATINAIQVTLSQIDKLEQKYEVSYYTDIIEAMSSINNNTIGQNQTAIKENANTAVYVDENGLANIILLNDVSTSDRITPTTNVAINLNGKTLTGTNLIAIDTSASSPVTINIDGRIDGSTIKVVQTGTNQARAIQVRTGSKVNVIGGTYIGITEKGDTNTIYSMASGEVNISNAVILAESSSASAKGFSITSGAIANISNCDITSRAVNNTSVGIYNYGNATVSNCTIEAYSNMTRNFTSYSQGISNYDDGEMLIKDCYVFATHSGVQNSGTLKVEGGTYESFAHGGFYLAGTNKTAYIKDAISRECPMPDGYTHNYTDPNGAGLYVGGSSSMTDIKVYIDNCEFYGSKHPLVLRDTDGEKNNSIYISNSSINLDKKIRIDNDTHKLYIGVGNNFTADNVNLPTSVVETNEIYRFE